MDEILQFKVKSLGDGEINYLRLGLHKVDQLDEEEEDSEENCSSRFSCSTESSLADSLMDDGGNDFSSTPSMSSPEPNYTRGIINPNYPGFQHLAHTLSEHFANYNFEQLTDDSEISEECDNDLSLGGGVDFVNNFNNNNHFAENSNILSENGNDVEKNINLLQTSECKIFCEEKNLALVSFEEKISNAAVDAKWLKDEAKGKRDLPTPDILLKSEDTPEADNFCMNDTPSETSPHANFQPDLLRNIDGSREIKRQHRDVEIVGKIEIETQSRQEEHIVKRDEPDVAQQQKAQNGVGDVHVNCTDEEHTEDDEGEIKKMTTPVWGATPVDIVGDFGEEVEREIVLIVSGYRKSTRGVSDSNFNNSAQDTKLCVKSQPSDSNISTLIHNK
uniref:Uncharacterized protein n=1 Tax=Phlebotomus papatasi TaxID=29031 RepID=A0A1B0D097_PHLPP